MPEGAAEDVRRQGELWPEAGRTAQGFHQVQVVRIAYLFVVATITNLC